MSDTFATRVIRWQREHGRHALPWQNTTDPYRIWLSEIMLQQTQVATVLPYYERFLQRYPSVAQLAAAPLDEVMSLWAGLGYYTRARNLHACARMVVAEHGGEFPRSADALAELPGIGRSTAAAIAAFAWGERAAILDGNVRRVLARHEGIAGDPTTSAVQRQLWTAAEALLPQLEHETDAHAAMVRYTQGLMDLGATVCTRGMPACERCPLAATCVALREARQLELPGKRQRRHSPERRIHWLWLRASNHTLLERRPASGIWGGLWSLPELSQPPGLADVQALGIKLNPAETPIPLPPVQHTFTHFRLVATPWQAQGEVTATADDSRYMWVADANLVDAPLPTPVRNLLLTDNAGDDDVSS